MQKVGTVEDFRLGIPGFYSSIDHSDYARLAAINATALKQFFRSPLHFKHYLDSARKDTPSLSLGRATHTAVFEPEKFKEYVVMPKFDGRTTSGKNDKADWLTKNEGKIIIEQDEYEKATKIKKSCYNHSRAKQLLDFSSHNELSIVWNDPATGLLCKGRIDRYVMMDYGDGKIIPAILDLKTCQDASPESFDKDIFKYKYYFSLAFYCKGLTALSKDGKVHDRAIIIAAETPEPNDVVIHELSALWLASGFWQIEDFLKTCKQCRETGIYEGYSNNILTSNPPVWAFPNA